MATDAIDSLGDGVKLDFYSTPDHQQLGTSRADIDEMLQEVGALNGHAFKAFYFLISEIFLKGQGNSDQKNIARLADNLKELSGWAKRFNEIKAMFYGARDSDAPVYNFAPKVADYINDLLAPLNDRQFHVPSSPAGINIEVFDRMISTLEAQQQADPEKFDELFPAMGGSSLCKILRGIEEMGPTVFFHDNQDPDYAKLAPKFPTLGLLSCDPDLKEYWNKIENGQNILNRLVEKYHEDGSEYWENDPINIANAQYMSSDINSMSQVSSLLTGVSSTESSKLQYKEQEYNRLMSFVKEMLSDWQKIKKVGIQHMGQR